VHVVSLEHYRRTAPSRTRSQRRIALHASFYFDLASPYTYLAAERAERTFAGLRWLPACMDALQCGAVSGEDERALVEERAAQLGLPLVWPAVAPVHRERAMRVASLAAERGCGSAFVLAASRLVYCGGYRIDDPEILAEAAAAASIDLDEMLQAAGDIARDGPIEQTGRRLLAAGATRLPALRVGAQLFCGEARLAEAAAARASA
jgi:2-hydroxychromene-2-carboxylate isomerase